jgi:hypothetical protein
MVEVEGIPPPMSKPRLGLAPKMTPIVSVRPYGMGVVMLGILVDGKEDTFGFPQIEGHI